MPEARPDRCQHGQGQLSDWQQPPAVPAAHALHDRDRGTYRLVNVICDSDAILRSGLALQFYIPVHYQGQNKATLAKVG